MLSYALTFSEDTWIDSYGCEEDHEHEYCEQDSYALSVTLGNLYKTRRSVGGHEEINEGAPYGCADVPVGETAYLVVCEYIDGGTFGYSGYWCIAGLFADPEAAEKCRQACEGENYTDKAYRPWDGYFGSLCGCRVEALTVLA